MQLPRCALPPGAPPAGPLPPPDPAARAHSARLAGLIQARIDAAGGLLPFDRFMELALYAPGLGYYVAGSHKLGAGGDFVTAPEISPLFGRALARQAAEVLETLAGGDILEFGAGSGRLALDLLGELERLERLPRRYLILEPSPELRRRQQQLLATGAPRLLERVQWVDALPRRLHGLVLANEVLDAMPVHRFRIRDGSVRELAVTRDGEGFAEAERDPAPALHRAIRELEAQGIRLDEGYSSEINLRAAPWLHALGQCLEAGVVLLIDYGYPRREYYRPERSMGTLMCHYRHRAHPDPYRLVGLQDITAFVDFSALARAGGEAGLAPAGYTTQANFLLGCGLEELMADSDPSRVADHMALVQGAKQLVLPGEMGERFQVLALARGVQRPLRGFALRDLRARL